MTPFEAPAWAIGIVLMAITVATLRARAEVIGGVLLGTNAWLASSNILPAGNAILLSVVAVMSATALRLIHAAVDRGPDGNHIGRDRVLPLLFLGAWLMWIVGITLAAGGPDPVSYIGTFIVRGGLPALALAASLGGAGAEKRFVVSFVCGAALTLLLGYSEVYAGGGVPYGLVDISGFQRGLASVAGGNYHWMGHVAAAFALVCIATRWSAVPKRPLHSGLLVVGIVIGAFTTYASGARQSMPAFLAATAAIIGLHRRNASSRARMILPIAVFALGLLMYVQSEMWVLRAGNDAQVRELGGRTFYMQLAWNTFLESPIIGAGLQYGGLGEWAHNGVLGVLASQGIVGFALLGVWLHWQWRALLRVRSTDQRIGSIHLIGVGWIAYGLVAGLVTEFLFVPMLFVGGVLLIFQDSEVRREADRKWVVWSALGRAEVGAENSNVSALKPQPCPTGPSWEGETSGNLPAATEHHTTGIVQ